eukprot:3676599-Karenia_brevis.AAC.1
MLEKEPETRQSTYNVEKAQKHKGDLEDVPKLQNQRHDQHVIAHDVDHYPGQYGLTQPGI